MTVISSEIIELPDHIVKKIAAGEVIERPASVIKELVENSLDAGAGSIFVSTRGGGKKEITVKDDGIGIPALDLGLALLPHTTSKIGQEEDLYAISTLGFRGEALASIARVSRLEIVSKTQGADAGARIKSTGGKMGKVKECGASQGTWIKVSDLFYNLPARRNFLKGKAAEQGEINRVVTWLALARPDVSFKLESDGDLVFSTPGDGDVGNAVGAIFGLEIQEALLPLGGPCDPSGGLKKISGLVSAPHVKRASKDNVFLFVNRRYVKSKPLVQAVRDGYSNLIPKGYFPFAVMFLEIEPGDIDVNVHPTKIEILFKEERAVAQAVRGSVKKTLENAELTAPVKAKHLGRKRQAKAKTDSKGEKAVVPPLQSADLRSFEPGLEGQAPEEISSIGRIRGLKAKGEQHHPSLDLHIIGQVKRSYIVCEGPDGLVLIDQHAAHERIMYETLKSLRSERLEIKKQCVLEPYVIRLDPTLYQQVISNLEKFEEYSFGLEDFGPGSVKVSAVPSVMGRFPNREGVKDIIQDVLEGKIGFDEKMLRLMACKTAIKANTPLTRAQMASLLDQMCSIDNPWACAHGRPTVLKISYSKIEREFLRT